MLLAPTMADESTRVELSAAFAPNARTQPIIEGSIHIEGVRLKTTAVHASEMFWRQLKFAEFDVSEMSCASLMIAASRGPIDWVAVPVFTMRRLFHTGILVRRGAGIEKPADLRGKRVGVPEYQQTAAVWTRGILSDEFGLDPRTIEWFMERPLEQSHGGSTGFEPPEGVRLSYIPRSTNIGEMLGNGQLDATLLYLNDRNLIDRSRSSVSELAGVQTLFPSPAAEGRRFYEKTKVYPINHTVVVRRSVLDRYPWIALNLYQGFVRVKEELATKRSLDLEPWVAMGRLDEAALRELHSDPLPYGIAASHGVLDTIARYLFEQGLTSRKIMLAEIFAPSTLDL